MVPFLGLYPIDNILWPLFCALLSKIKVKRNFLLAITTSPITVRGLGFCLLATEQFLSSIFLITTLFHSSFPSAPLLHESLKYLQLECGLDYPIFYSLFNLFSPFTTPTWLITLWEYLSFYQIHLHILYSALPSSAHTNN